MKTALDADYVYFIEKDTRILAVPKWGLGQFSY